MVNEINLSLNVRVQNGNFKNRHDFGNLKFDQRGIGRGGYVQTINSSASEALNMGDVTTYGWIVMRSLSTAGSTKTFVDYGPASTGSTMLPFGRMRDGEPAVFRLKPGISIMAKTVTTGSTNRQVDFSIYED